MGDPKYNQEFEPSLKRRQLLDSEDESSVEISTAESAKKELSLDLTSTPNSVDSSLKSETEEEESKKPIEHKPKLQDSGILGGDENVEESIKGNPITEDENARNLPGTGEEEQPENISEGESSKPAHQKPHENKNSQENASEDKTEGESVSHDFRESETKEESEAASRDNEQEVIGHKGQGTKKHKEVNTGEELIDHKNQPENVAREHGEHNAISATTPRPRKGAVGPNLWHKIGVKGQGPPRPVQPTTKASNESGPTAVPIEEECTVPAYHEFPPDLFTHRQRARGAVIIHIAVIIYMFYAVAVVCDDYFVASLEECCNRLNLSEDVAGATFMAAGSSTPELFTAILGVLVAKGDVGTGTIVGSAVFNVLFVIGICGIFAGRVVELTWWPLFRDSFFYSCTVVLLIAIIFDSEVTWYESVIMMLNYGLYIVLMKFNNDVHFWFSRRLGIEDDMTQNIGILAQGDKKNYSSYVPFNNEIDECASMPVTARFSLRAPTLFESFRTNGFRITSIYEAALFMMMKPTFVSIKPVTRFRVLVYMIIVEQRRMKKEANKMQGQISIESQETPKFKSISSTMGLTAEANWKQLPTREEGIKRLLLWLIQAPLLAVLHYTIPDCRKDEYRKFFLLTFFSSITWTAIFSYVMVWMVTLVGYTLGIPDSIMGITFLAAGTSVPDAFASLIVARQGQGDMAVSNSLGSNIFDILIGLAFPWFIQTAMVEPGSIATINSRGIVYSVILLFLTIIITIGGIFFSRWQLTPRLGVVLLSVYALFLVISILLEFNFLGHVNPPMCQD